MEFVNKGRSIHIYLVDGEAEGLQVATRPGWTGSLLAFSRANYADARDRHEFNLSGVYVLAGPSESGSRSSTVYIGEGDVTRTRLDSHHRSKDFWTRGYLLTTQNNYLNKAHIRYLESRLIHLAIHAEVSHLENGTAPYPAGLSEAEISDMEVFLGEALPLFKLLGVDTFDAPRPELSTASSTAAPDPVPAVHGRVLYLNSHGVAAEGRDDPRGFYVTAGAPCRREAGSIGGYARLRELISDGTLTEATPTQLRLTRDFRFESPSAAATVLTGTSRNGRMDWRTADGTPLKELQQREAEATTPVDHDHAILAPYLEPAAHSAATVSFDEVLPHHGTAASSRTQVVYDEDIILLLNLGYLRPGDELRYVEKRKGLTHLAVVEPDGALRVNGRRFGSPSGTLRHSVGYQVNGWVTWRTKDDQLLDELRRHARNLAR